jgi:hypothetical protein
VDCSPAGSLNPPSAELKGFKTSPSELRTMSDATKVVLGTVGVAGLLSLLVIVALAL